MKLVAIDRNLFAAGGAELRLGFLKRGRGGTSLRRRSRDQVVVDPNSAAARGLDVAPWLIESGARSNLLELNGARSNPRAGVELSRLGALHDELLRRALANPCEPRPIPAKVSPVTETVNMVLERAEEPMRAQEIHAAAERLTGESLRWTSVKAALSAGVVGERPRFRRVRHGVYQLARDVKRCTSRAALPTRSPR